MDAEAELRRLASKIKKIIRSKPDVLGGHTTNVPDIRTAKFEISVDAGLESRPKAYQYVDHFESMVRSPELKQLINLLKDVEEYLIWGHAPGYTRDNVGQEFLDNYCHALLSGPDGPLRCEVPLGAFVLFGPDTLYKDHSHVPNEVYLAITGGGEWRVGENPWVKLDEGDSIFIPSNAVHAIRTGSKPLLTFSFWLESADLESINI
ncbi:MAG: dimethylsulfonioproprionate lyase family protein [Granulosicoccus sp.]